MGNWNSALQVSTLGQALVTHGSSGQILATKPLLHESENTRLSSWPWLGTHLWTWGGFLGELVWRKILQSCKIQRVPETRTSVTSLSESVPELGQGTIQTTFSNPPLSYAM